MKTISNIILFFIAIFFLFSACKHKEEDPLFNLNEKLKFDLSEYQKEIKNLLNYSNLNDDSSIQFYDSLKYFYSQRNYEPVLISSFEEHELIYLILNFLQKADEHGLNPEDYHYSKIAEEFSTATVDTIINPNRFYQLAVAEILTADAILKYSAHLRYGVVNPKTIFNESYNLPIPDSLQRKIIEPLYQEDIVEYLKSIEPKNDKYQKLKAALQKFENLRDKKWELIPKIEGKILPGDNHPAMEKITANLISFGFIDTASISINEWTYYDSIFTSSVKKFQRIHGLNEDGVIGNETIQRLNMTPEDYIEKIKLSLERFRWIDYSVIPRYILVNIPDFKLYAIENKKALFDIKVCTGIKRPANFDERMKYYKQTKKISHKPDDWETPVLYAEISYMVLNPTWNVPVSIIREEIFREMKKDSNYLHIKNFKVYKGNEEINLNDVDIKELASDNVPYRIVQDPGPGNALGKIKFMFNNPFGIYLHDTPTRPPFSLSNRAVSHGCVRVEKPLQLAEYILRDHPKWNIDYLKIEIGERVSDREKIREYRQRRENLRKYASLGQTTDVNLEKKIPLVIDYYTAWVDENGDVNFREDVYNKDKILKQYLFNNNN